MKRVPDLGPRLRDWVASWRADCRAALDERCMCNPSVPIDGMIVLPACEVHDDAHGSEGPSAAGGQRT